VVDATVTVCVELVAMIGLVVAITVVSTDTVFGDARNGKDKSDKTNNKNKSNQSFLISL
jgi:hypothetical protein